MSLEKSFVKKIGNNFVQCCGKDSRFDTLDFRYSVYRTWVKTKKFKAKIFNGDRYVL